MAKPPSLVVSALATWNGKALTKGKKEISQFDAATQKLGKTFAKVFGTIAVASFAKNAVNAFIESEKAAAKLRTTVKNLGLEFQQPGIEDYLKSLSLQFGIVDENLIPGFQRLLITTRDVAKAQSLFETALNVSAGTGKDLTTVATSLSKAYLGDNAALGRLGVGLSKAQLKSASFLDIQKQLNANFSGQAAAAVQGYAGDMAKLTVAIDESKEAIGKGLLDALKALSGDTSIDSFTQKMVQSAETIGNAFRSIADFVSLLNPSSSVKIDGKWVRKNSIRPQTSSMYGERDSLATTKKLTKARKDELSIITSSNKTRTEIDKLSEKFDLERIGLTKALNETTDAETKLRLEAKIAILDNNEALAKKINAEMEAGRKAQELANSFGNATSALDAQIAKLRNMTEDLVNKLNARVAAGTFNPTGYNIPGLNQLFPTPQGPLGSIDYTVPMGSGNPVYAPGTSGTPMSYADVRLTIDVAQAGDQFAQLIADSVQVAQRSGYSTTSAGSLN
jgi:hypothetical protein